MRHQIVRIAPLQAGKVVAIVWGIISLLFVPIFLLAGLGGTGKSGVFLLLFAFMMPLLYVVFGFLLAVIFAWLYNVVASRVGGIEITLATLEKLERNGVE